MPNLQASGTISLNDLKAFFGGPAAPKLSDYYRGGSYVPATANVTTETRQPATGEYYNPNNYVWDQDMTNNNVVIRWLNVQVYSAVTLATIITVGGNTYYRGNLYDQTNDQYGGSTRRYGVYRIATTTTSQNVNQNVPASGLIKLSDFYGAYKP